MGRYVVGIDLGTTHTVVAASPHDAPDIEVFRLPQLTAPGEVGALEQIASSIYLPGEGEFDKGATRLPWDEAPAETGYFLGAFAAQHGLKAPGRLVVSAKSWLSYARVDRTAAILPWGAPEDVQKVSPVEAARRTLAHVRRAWDHKHPDDPLASQDVVVTVPASFDEVARELTVRAAADAGLPRLRLLEEPQAALYDFIAAHGPGLSKTLKDVRLVLVVDVGGGTTDLTLVRVEQKEGETPSFERVAVGEHLMLGGDNMDLAVARHVEMELTGTLGSLSAAQWGSLAQAARLAKESLLSPDPPEEYGVALPGRGRSLVGGGQKHTLQRAQAEELLIEGFLPKTAPDELPETRGRAGFTELSLPYAADAAVSRHVCAFLRQHVRAAEAAGAKVAGGLPRPDAVLLNGGVFKSAVLTGRLSEVLAGWYDDEVPYLESRSVDSAVARGAAYYGLVRRGHGVRISGGTARSYFIGVEGEEKEAKALCVVPRGVEEGESYTVDREFRLVLGKPVTFHLYTTTVDDELKAGDVVAMGDHLRQMPPMHTVLRPPDEVPVNLRVELTELGTIQVGLSMTEEALTSWDLEMSTRATSGDDDAVAQGKAPAPAALPPQLLKKIDSAKELIDEAYAKKPKKGANPKAVKNLRNRLEALLGAREEWSTALCRELFGVLIGGKDKRRRSPDHERLFFNLAGYLVRPGTGVPLDDWRTDELWELFDDGVQYVKEKRNWSAWWTMWRRAAGGLDAERQAQVLETIRWHVTPQSMREGKAPKGQKPHGVDEMVRLAASLERLPAEEKSHLGDAVLHMLHHDKFHSWWPLGRLGSRQPYTGSIDAVVAPEVAEGWLKELLKVDWDDQQGAALAAALIARRTGDRARDVDDEVREKVRQRLENNEAPEGWLRMVTEVVPPSEQEDASILGESLPVGLKLGG